jgi:alkylation response protein AidB-like acyl-CoA dehydrogenase
VDFGLNEQQEAVRDLARRILGDRTPPERLKQLEAGEDPFDRSTWGELGEAGLLGVGLPEDLGGGGLGLLEVGLVLEEVGRHVAPLPVLPSIVMGAMAVAAFGTDEQRSKLVPAAASGDTVLTAALVEFGALPEAPTTTARRDGEGWRLDGVKLCVPAGMAAELVLVPAAADYGLAVFLVDPAGPGVTRERLDTTSGLPEARLELAGATVGADRVLAEPGRGETVVDWVVQRATVGLCATMVGVCEQALALTAEHTKTREQFERPLATFQAVAQRAADAYIDTEAVRLTTWQAAWRLSENLSAADEVAVAKYWAADGGQRVVHAAQHLHGGLGVDRDYPLHRYFLWAKQLELTLGGATASLLRLGRALAAQPV